MTKDKYEIIEVLNSRKKIAVCPGFGCTPAILDEIISLGYDEITLRKKDLGYIKRNSVAKKYEGSSRTILEKHLYDNGWRQWNLDNYIWLAPGHSCFE